MPEDLLNFGLIPEFIGRLPVVSAVHQLKREDLVQILTEPKNALVKQYQRFFNYDHIDLVFTEDALWSIADKALDARDRRPRPALDHRERAARRDVRAAVAQGRLQVRDHEGDDREGPQADARHLRRRRPRRATSSPKSRRSLARRADPGRRPATARPALQTPTLTRTRYRGRSRRRPVDEPRELAIERPVRSLRGQHVVLRSVTRSEGAGHVYDAPHVTLVANCARIRPRRPGAGCLAGGASDSATPRHAARRRGAGSDLGGEGLYGRRRPPTRRSSSACRRRTSPASCTWATR